LPLPSLLEGITYTSCIKPRKLRVSLDPGKQLHI
jgi:hypothetical protein